MVGQGEEFVEPARLAAAAALLAGYFLFPLPFLPAIEASDSYSVKTVREVEARTGIDAINKVMDKKQLQALIDQTYRLCGEKETVLLADRLRTLGYSHATFAGISICIDP